MRTFPILLALLLTAVVSEAAPTIACHCFKDREFDPSRPAAVAPYVLATAQNSLLSAAFGIDKSTVVRARMGGTPAEDLWVASWVSARTGLSSDRVTEAKEKAGSWSGGIAALRLDPARLGPEFSGLVAARGGAEALAAAAADEVIATAWKVPRDELKTLRSKGAATGELVAAVLIGRRLSQAPAKVFTEAKSGRKSWGTGLREAGLEPRGIEGEIRKAFPK